MNNGTKAAPGNLFGRSNHDLRVIKAVYTADEIDKIWDSGSLLVKVRFSTWKVVSSILRTDTEPVVRPTVI